MVCEYQVIQTRKIKFSGGVEGEERCLVCNNENSQQSGAVVDDEMCLACPNLKPFS